MQGYFDNLEEKTETNNFFRQVVFTGKNLQLVLMSLKPLEEIGMEIHPQVDQFFRIEEGEGKLIMNDKEYFFKEGFGIVVPAGTKHNLINTSKEKNLKLYTIYAPPNHPAGTVHKTKQEAIKAEKNH